MSNMVAYPTAPFHGDRGDRRRRRHRARHGFGKLTLARCRNGSAVEEHDDPEHIVSAVPLPHMYAGMNRANGCSYARDLAIFFWASLFSLFPIASGIISASRRGGNYGGSCDSQARRPLRGILSTISSPRRLSSPSPLRGNGDLAGLISSR